MKGRLDTAKARLIAGLAVTAALFVPLAVLGGPALARSTAAASEYQYSGSAQYQYRVTICHRTGSKKHPFHTITVSSASVPAHLRHGDQLGSCSSTSTSTSTSTDPVTPQNGNGSHGNGKGHGNGNAGNQGNGKGHGHG